MTEKRFTIKKDGIGQYTVSDKLNQFGMPITAEMNCKIIAYALNELHEENKELQKELGLFKPIIFETENGATTLYEKRDFE